MIKKTILIGTLLFAVFLTLATVIVNHYFPLNDPEQLKSVIAESETLGPFLIVLLQAAQVILVPIPGQITGVVSGYFFGPFLGTLYSMIGLALGSFIVFRVSKKLGRPFVERVLEKKTLKKFGYLSENTRTSALFLVFLFPMLPDDAICFLAGLTKIKTRTFMLTAITGRLPGCFLANAIGSGIAVSTIQIVGIFSFSAIIFIVFLYLFRDNMENKMNSYIKNVTQEND